MQPRRLLCPRPLTVSQVTKSGYSSSRLFVTWSDRLIKEKKDELDEDLEEGANAAWDDVAESEEGVDALEADAEAEAGDGTRRAFNDGGLRLAGIGSSSSSSSSSSSRSMTIAPPAAFRALSSKVPASCRLYCSHESSTCDKLGADRLCRLEERHSKQNTQYAVVAIKCRRGVS